MSTIIIGAGINGLLLGALLSHDGEKVIVFEKNSLPGGRAFLNEKDGFTFDYGVHLTRFGPDSALAAIMDHIEKPVAFKKMGKSHVIDNGVMHLFPTSPGGIFKSSLFTLGEKLKLIRLILKIKKGEFNNGYMDTSLRDWMMQNSVAGGIKTYMECLSSSIMVCPFIEKTSAGEMFRNIYKVLQTGHSAEYLAGGWKPVYDALIETIENNGELYLNKKVDKVIVTRGKASGVVVGRKKYTADRVIINLPVQEMFSIISVKNFDKEYVKKCKNLVPTSGISFDIALKERISNLDGLIYTTDPMAYGLIASNLEPQIAPAGGQILTMLYPVSLEDVKNRGMVNLRKQELWKAVGQYFPGIEKKIAWKRESVLKMVDGVQVNTNQIEEKRPGPVVPGLQGLFLVGDTIAAPGAGGDIGNESVLLTYNAVTGKEFPSS